MEIDPLTSTNSTAEIVQNIISQLLAEIVEDVINKDLKICNAKEKVNIWKKETKRKNWKFSDISGKKEFFINNPIV